MVKKARQSATEQIPAFREHTFACPYCDKPTTVLSPMDHIFMKRPRCENCGKEFLIREHRAEKLRQWNGASPCGESAPRVLSGFTGV